MSSLADERLSVPTDKGANAGLKVASLVAGMVAGADSIAGDPITHLRYSPKAHGHAAARLCRLADEYCQGRLVAMGGGGYNRTNLALAWTEVVKALAA